MGSAITHARVAAAGGAPGAVDTLSPKSRENRADAGESFNCKKPDDAGLKRLAAVEDRRMKESKKSCLAFSARYFKKNTEEISAGEN